MKYSFIFIALLYCQLNLASAQTMPKLYELTLVDLTTKENVNVDNISVFGVHLGMTRDEAKAAMKKYPELRWDVDIFHTTQDYRIYVYDKSSEERDKSVMYLIWRDNREKMNQITVYDRVNPRLQGEMQNLFTSDPLDTNSVLSKKLFGISDSSAVTLDLPSIEEKITQNYFKENHLTFAVNHYHAKITYYFILAEQ